MSEPPIASGARRLTPDQRAQYPRWGYIKNLPLFADAAVPRLQAEVTRLMDRLPDGVDVNRVNMWHKANRWYYTVCRTPAILDYVEDLLGPSFYQWGGQFLVKRPGDGSVVPWHQDAQYSPLPPRRTVTVWLAVDDADAGNGAMRVVRGSHLSGEVAHREVQRKEYVLEQEADPESIDSARVVSIDLKAGEISLHDDGLIHGSGPNTYDRSRDGLTMRFSPTEVTADRTVWPTFDVSTARGEDTYGRNPHAKAPGGDAVPVRRFQHSSEFP